MARRSRPAGLLIRLAKAVAIIEATLANAGGEVLLEDSPERAGRRVAQWLAHLNGRRSVLLPQSWAEVTDRAP